MSVHAVYRPFKSRALFSAIDRAKRSMPLFIESRNRTIEENLALVSWQARKTSHLRISVKDLIQEGSIGLLRAVEKHDPELGAISTYGIYWIRQAMWRARAEQEQKRVIRIPIHVIEDLAKMIRAQQSLTKQLEREPTLQEIAQRAELKITKVKQLLDIPVAELILDKPVSQDEYSQPVEVIDQRSPDGLEEMVQASLQKNMIKALHSLNPTERYVIIKRFGLLGEGEQSLKEIGDHFDLSRERIRQIEQAALKKLAHPSRSADLRPFLD